MRYFEENEREIGLLQKQHHILWEAEANIRRANAFRELPHLAVLVLGKAINHATYIAEAPTEEAYMHTVLEGGVRSPIPYILGCEHSQPEIRGAFPNQLALAQLRRLEYVPTVVFGKVCVLQVAIRFQGLRIQRYELRTHLQKRYRVVVRAEELRALGIDAAPCLGDVPHQL